MQVAAVIRSSSVFARPVLRRFLSETKFQDHVGRPRCFSTTVSRKQKTEAATGVASTVTQVNASATPPVGESVDYGGADEPTSIYDGDYLPHNTPIYSDFLAMEQAEKVVDISATSDLTISQVAEGLSTDILTASGVVPTLQDMGLGSFFTPSGLLQNALDFLHNMGLPWWVAIASTTIVIRSLMVPIAIKAVRNSANLSNIMPEMQRLQQKMNEAKESGNWLEAAKAGNDLAIFMKEKNHKPFDALLPVLTQAPVFLSFLWALREMANLPMESMKTGGIAWFTDLTVPDPYYALPLVTCATMYIMIETGADGISPNNLKSVKWVVRGMPVILFAFAHNFSAAVLCYWTTSNLFSLGQTLILRNPTIRAKLNIPAIVKRQTAEQSKPKSLIQGAKDTYKKLTVTSDISKRARADEDLFRAAGAGPIVKTYKYPPKLKRTAKN